MTANACAEFKLSPCPQRITDLQDINQLQDLLESMHNANVLLLQEVAKLRAEVTILKG